MGIVACRIGWLLIALAVALPARGEVKQSAADTLSIAIEAKISAPPRTVFDAIVHVERWWSSEHTYSEDAGNLSLMAEPGGCFCERWKDGGVEHGRVILVLRDKLLRLAAPLGPLQGKAVEGVLTFQLKPADGGTALTVGYLVNGTTASALDKSAAGVDRVLTEQVQRLKHLIETGKPAE
ncbi:MAG TPA: ATPase [Casimicrobiaceae bacterium]